MRPTSDIPGRSANCGPRSRQGFVLLSTAVAMVGVIGLLGLAVDVGRIYVTKSELQAYAGKVKQGRLRAFDMQCDQEKSRNIAERLAKEYRSMSRAEFDRSLSAIRAETRPPARYRCLL